MKYFTEELYRQLQSEDAEQAAEAMEQWTENSRTYRAELRKLEPNLPPALKRFVKKECLHDGQLIQAQFTQLLWDDSLESIHFLLTLTVAAESSYYVLNYVVERYPEVWQRVLKLPEPPQGHLGPGPEYSLQRPVTDWEPRDIEKVTRSPVHSSPYWICDEWSISDSGLLSHSLLLSSSIQARIPYILDFVYSRVDRPPLKSEHSLKLTHLSET